MSLSSQLDTWHRLRNQVLPRAVLKEVQVHPSTYGSLVRLRLGDDQDGRYLVDHGLEPGQLPSVHGVPLVVKPDVEPEELRLVWRCT